jgi:hypothetical protein
MGATTKETVRAFNSTAVSVEKYFLFSSLALIIVFAWMEPAGAAGIGFWKGLIFWSIQLSILIPLLIATQHFVSHYDNLLAPQAPWLQTALSGALASLVFVPIGYLLDVLFSIPENESSSGILYGLLDEASGVVVPVTITWLALNAPWIFQLDFSRKQSEAASEQQDDKREVPSGKEAQSSRFLRELRSRVKGDLISISSELHYIRVTTSDAEVMFLYNLKDAIEELPANAGIQVHRSHWVSREHIKKLTKKNGSSECVLSNGNTLPVSRRKYTEVRELLQSSPRDALALSNLAQAKN